MQSLSPSSRRTVVGRIGCETCLRAGKSALYEGESGRNAYIRCSEHLDVKGAGAEVGMEKPEVGPENCCENSFVFLFEARSVLFHL